MLKNIFQVNGHKEDEVDTLISNKINQKKWQRNFMLIKGKSTKMLFIMIIYSPNAKPPIFVKKKKIAKS